MLRIDKLTKRFSGKIAVDTATLDIDKPCMSLKERQLQSGGNGAGSGFL